MERLAQAEWIEQQNSNSTLDSIKCGNITNRLISHISLEKIIANVGLTSFLIRF